LDGYTKTSKTTDGTIVLTIYRKRNDKVGLASVNNIARLGQELCRDTFPKLVDEVKLDPKIQSDLIEAMKHAVQGLTARTKLAVTSEPIDIPALSPCIFTSNHRLPTDPALRRRFLNYYYSKDDKPKEEDIREFESFLKHGWNSLGTLGDFTICYLLQHQELIINDINDWPIIAKTVLEKLFKAANKSLPDWIDVFSGGNQIEDVEAEEEQIIRSFFKKKIDEIFSRNYKAIEPWKEQQIDSVTSMNRSIMERLNFCLDSQLIPFMQRKKSDTGQILITMDILKELRDEDINFIQYLTDLARLLGSESKPAKLDGKPVRLVAISIEKLIDYINKEPV
jgi:hypothetical protein